MSGPAVFLDFAKIAMHGGQMYIYPITDPLYHYQVIILHFIASEQLIGRVVDRYGVEASHNWLEIIVFKF